MTRIREEEEARAVNGSQDVINMSDGHRNIVIR